MFQNRRRLSGVAWFVAGLPILASFVQALIALLGTSATAVPILGTLKQTFQSVIVFDAAGTIFRSSSTIVFVLFVLVTIAWLLQGVGMFGVRNRVYTLGATGFVTLFLALFVLVYLPLLSADVPTSQAIAFLFVPIVAAAASWTASLSYDWDITLADETSNLLEEARSEARTSRQTFDSLIQGLDDERVQSSLRRVAPDAADEFKTRTESFRDECDAVISRAEDLVETQPSLSSHQRNEQATQLLTDAQNLNPEERAGQLRADLQKGVIDGVRSEYGDLHYVSRYGEAYEVRNLRSFNELSAPALDGPPIQIGGAQHELAERLVETVETQGVETAAQTIERAENHLTELEETLSNHEDAVASILDEVDAAIDQARDHLDSLDGAAKERLSEYLLEGRAPDEAPDIPAQPSVQNHVDDAKAALHAGRFQEAKREARDARQEAQDLQAVAEFFAESVVATIDYGSGAIPIPDTVGRDLVEQLRVPFEQSYPVEYNVDGSTLEVAADEADLSVDEDRQHTGQSRTSSGDVVADDVMYVLRELKTIASATSSDDTVELQTERLPEKFVDPDILNEVKAFGERQSDVVSVAIPDDPPPGYLSVKVADNASPQRVIGDMQDAYAKS